MANFLLKGEEGKEEVSATPAPSEMKTMTKLTNQFNFSERASQTYNNPYRVRTKPCRFRQNKPHAECTVMIHV